MMMRPQVPGGTAHRGLLAALMLFPLMAGTALAQQITGTPGSPSTTTTIDGKYLSPPPQHARANADN